MLFYYYSQFKYIFSTLLSNTMGNRSRTEIVAMILDAANGGTTKTKIMYFAFLKL